MRKIDLTKVEVIDVTKGDPIVTPMPEPVVIPDALTRTFGEPEGLWYYRLPDGTAYGAVVRWSPEGKRKEIRPIVWNGKKHITSGFGESRPLYNGDLIAASPVATVLIVEGEKAANAAQEYIPEGWVVTTWQGGAKATDKTDWSALAGHTCVLWPDNDSAGISAGEDIRKHLSRLSVPSTLIGIPPSFPDGWDLADDLPPKVTKPMINQLLRRALRDASVMNELAAPEAQEVEAVSVDGSNLDFTLNSRWRPIGYDNQVYYLMNDSAEQIWGFTAAKLMSEAGMREIVEDTDYWREEQGVAGGKKVNWTEAGANVMTSCVRAGVYNPDRIRGRGVWIDKDSKGTDRVLLHAGEELYLTREAEDTLTVPFARIRSRWYYTRTRPIITDEGDGVDYTTQATDAEGLEIREMLKLLRWQSPVHADLLAGWIATAMVCGALPWRTHCWVTGNQGSGKSTVVDKLVGALLGDVALYPLGTTTEAGLRQAIGSDARPVIFDESEGDKHKEERRQAIIQLMRQSSSDTRGLIMKGGANHESKSFTMRSAFLMSSIGVGLKEAADLTRTAVLTLKPSEACSLSELNAMEEQFQRLQSSILTIRRDMPQRLLARQMANIWALKKNIETFKEVIATSMANRRIGDQLGTLLAGAYSLSSKRAITKGACQKYLDAYDWSEFTSVSTVREDIALMHHICGSLIKVETRTGTQDRAIGELLHSLLFHNPAEEPDVYPPKAVATLSRYGLRIDESKMGVWIATNVATLNRVMASSVYSEGWQKVLARNPACRKGDKSQRFGGEVSRAIYLPLAEWPITERFKDDEEG